MEFAPAGTSSGSTFTAHAGGAADVVGAADLGVATAASRCDRGDNQAPGYCMSVIRSVRSKSTPDGDGCRLRDARRSGEGRRKHRARREDLLLLRQRAACSAFRRTRRSISIPRIAPACTRCRRRAAAPLTLVKLRRGGSSDPPALQRPAPASRLTLPNTRARCTPRCVNAGRARARSAAWRSSRVEVTARGGAERRARRHEPPLLVVARADGSDSRLHGVRGPARAAAASSRVAASR